MATNGKDTIYIDIDDEITTVIEKVKGSGERIVALVLPKRASVLQSIVNMKLLKRSADQVKKQVVLITSETGLLPMAGAVGFYVAKNLQTKPAIPAVPGAVADSASVDEAAADSDTYDFTAENAADKPVGELAAAAGTPLLASPASNDIETLQLDDDAEDAPEAAEATAGVAAATPVKLKKDRKLAVPNFNRFRVLLVLGGLLILLLVGAIYLATAVLPKATITISTDTSDINSNLTLNLDTSAANLDPAKMVVPAKVEQIQKNGSQQVATTGKKNIGTPATGSITMSAKECAVTTPSDVGSGIGVTYNGMTYITQGSTTFAFDHISSGCIYYKATTATSITAQNPGTQYNTGGTVNFTVYGRSDVSASGSASGGTDNVVQVVAQADIDSATQKITSQNSDSVKQQLIQQLQQEGLYPIQTTFAAGTPAVTQSSNVGDQVSTVTVTQTTTYTMFGVKQADLKTLVDNDVKDKIDPSKQTILSEGLDTATYRLNNATATTAQIALSTSAVAGPDLQTSTIKQQVAGKKSGDIQTLLKADPGVTNVDVKFSPFWVTKAPSKPSKLTVVFIKATP